MHNTIVHVKAIPDQLREYAHFVVWAYVDVGGRKTKKPLNPKNPRLGADSTDPRTWSDLVTAYRTSREYDLGLGFVFTGTPFTGIDLDWKACEGEGVPEEAQKIIDYFDAYTELSPSGKGCHIIVTGKLDKQHKNRAQYGPVDIEVYSEARFFTLTGDIFDGMPFPEERQEALTKFADHFLSRKEAPKVVRETSEAPIDYAERLRYALSSTDVEFSRLYNGDISRYSHADGSPDQSRADSALVMKLLFWLDGDPYAVDQCFRSSALYRDKWDKRHSSDGRTYGEMTIQNAVAAWRGDVYKRRTGITYSSVERVREAYREVGQEVLDQGFAVIARAQGHGHSKRALETVWFELMDGVADKIWHADGEYIIQFGGVNVLATKTEASRVNDTKNRLMALADMGFVQDVKRREVNNPMSPIICTIPANPRDLGIMQLKAREMEVMRIQGAQKKYKPRLRPRKPLDQARRAQGSRKAKLAQSRFIARLLKRPRSVPELCEVTGAGQHTVKRHLRVLIEAEVVKRLDGVYQLIADYEEAARLDREYRPSYRARVHGLLLKTVDYLTVQIANRANLRRSPEMLDKLKRRLEYAEERLSLFNAGVPSYALI